jgi:hypothetical protein
VDLKETAWIFFGWGEEPVTESCEKGNELRKVQLLLIMAHNLHRNTLPFIINRELFWWETSVLPQYITILIYYSIILLQYITTVYYYSILSQYITAVYFHSILLQYTTTVYYYSILPQYITTVYFHSILLQ